MSAITIRRSSILAIAFILIGSLGLSAGGKNEDKKSGSEPIYVGVSGPLTGPNAQYGLSWKKGFDLALKEINGKGGIKGKPLAYLFEDSQSDPKQSVLIAQKFVNDQRILVELGDFSSTASMAASAIYQRAGLVQFGFTNSHPDFTKGGDFIWSNSISQKDGGPLHADFVYDTGARSVIVFNLNTDWGKTTSDLTIRRLEERGVKILAREAYLPDEKDFKAALIRIKTLNPDGIVLVSYYNDAALLVQQIRGQGFTQPIIANGSQYSPKFIELGGAAVEGVFVSANFSIRDPRPEVQTAVKLWRDAYKEDPDYFGVHAYDTLKLIAAAIELGGPDRKGVRDGLAKIKDFPSIVYGKLAFDPVERRVARPRDARLVIQKGSFEIWDGKPAVVSK